MNKPQSYQNLHIHCDCHQTKQKRLQAFQRAHNDSHTFHGLNDRSNDLKTQHAYKFSPHILN